MQDDELCGLKRFCNGVVILLIVSFIFDSEDVEINFLKRSSTAIGVEVSTGVIDMVHAQRVIFLKSPSCTYSREAIPDDAELMVRF